MNREASIKNALARGEDPHLATAMAAFQVTKDEVTPEMRNQQKQWNYIYLYSAPMPIFRTRA